MQTNNKLREALKTMSNLFEQGVICTSYANSAEEMEQIEELYRKTQAALAAPPRNCDRFNSGDKMKDAEDAYGAWQRYCDDPTIPPSCKVDSAFKYWLFAPASNETPLLATSPHTPTESESSK